MADRRSDAMETMANRRSDRMGAARAIGGGAMLCAGTWLHPMGADPNDAAAAFAEYAADRLWVTSHLAQALGMALMTAALLCLSRRLEAGRGGTLARSLARVGAGGAVATLAAALALQAVDGVALKLMVDRWAAAPATAKDIVFEAAFAVRQIEIGLASLLSLISGLTIAVYGIALGRDPVWPRWLGPLALIASLPMIAAGIIMAQTGFSGLAMALSMPGSLAVLAWKSSLGALMWPRAARGSH